MIPALPAHAEVLAALHAAAFGAEERWGAPAFAAQLGLPGTFGLIDARGGFVLARALLDEAEVLTIAVHPKTRRQGVGGALLGAAMADAAARGAACMFLEVAESNAAARALYAARGFAPVGRRRGYFPGGVDALVLRAALSPCGAAAP